MGVGADINAGRPERYGTIITGYKYAPSIGGTTLGHFAPTASQRLTWAQWQDITDAATQSITALEAEIATSPWADVYADAKTAAAALNLVSDLQNRVMEQFAAWDGLANTSDWLLRK